MASVLINGVAVETRNLRTGVVLAGKGPDTWEACVTVADLRAAGLVPPLPPPTCVEEGCDEPRTHPVENPSPIWCETHMNEAYAEQQAWRTRRRGQSR